MSNKTETVNENLDRKAAIKLSIFALVATIVIQIITATIGSMIAND